MRYLPGQRRIREVRPLAAFLRMRPCRDLEQPSFQRRISRFLSYLGKNAGVRGPLRCRGLQTWLDAARTSPRRGEFPRLPLEPRASATMADSTPGGSAMNDA